MSIITEYFIPCNVPTLFYTLLLHDYIFMEMFLTINSREKINECKIFMYANKSKNTRFIPKVL